MIVNDFVREKGLKVSFCHLSFFDKRKRTIILNYINVIDRITFIHKKEWKTGIQPG